MASVRLTVYQVVADGAHIYTDSSSKRAQRVAKSWRKGGAAKVEVKLGSETVARGPGGQFPSVARYTSVVTMAGRGR